MVNKAINEFLCKHAQPDYVDEYGNVIRKPDGKAYKTGKVTGWDILWSLVIIPGLFILVTSFLISLIGDTAGKKILSYFGINIDVYWLIDPLIRGMIIVCGAIIISLVIIFILKIINKILTAEVAKCPLVEIPPKRGKCETCGAPLPYEEEEIKVSVRDRKFDRLNLGDCPVCKAPKLYDDEQYSIEIKNYRKPQPK